MYFLERARDMDQVEVRLSNRNFNAIEIFVRYSSPIAGVIVRFLGKFGTTTKIEPDQYETLSTFAISPDF
jgi:hypothetical protein